MNAVNGEGNERRRLFPAASYCTVNGAKALMHLEEGWSPVFVKHRKAMAHLDKDTEETREALRVNRAIGVKE